MTKVALPTNRLGTSSSSSSSLGPGRPSAGGPSGIVVRIQLHTPRLARAELGSVFEYGKKVSGNSRNNKIFEYGKKMSGNSRTNKIFEYGKKVSGNRKTKKSFGCSKNVTLLTPNYGKCLETGKLQNPLVG